MRSSHLLGNSRAGLVSSTVLLRIEFTATDASTPMRALLPHVSTLTSSAKLHILRFAASGKAHTFRCASSAVKAGALPAVFAQLGDIVFSRSTDIKDEAVYFCCTFPQIALGGRYPLSLPCGARTFLMMRPLGRTPRLSVPVALLFYLILGGMSNKLQFFSMADIMEVQSAKRGRYHEREGFCIF